MDFVKMHGLGNDFIIVEVADWDNADSFQHLAAAWCHRHTGIGADGLVLTGWNESRGVFMRIYNSDGSEAQMCGNAIRCIGRYAYERSWTRDSRLNVLTRAGIKSLQLIVVNGAVEQIRVDMGAPVLEGPDIPVAEGLNPRSVTIETDRGIFEGSAVSVGNPHCVIFVDSVEDLALAEIGPQIENARAFPEKTNVEFVQVLNDREVLMRVWERGCGITMACGTGACASVVASVLAGKTGEEVTVKLPGGELFIAWERADNKVYMSGPAEEVFRGSISLNR